MSTHSNNQNLDFKAKILPKVSIRISSGKHAAGSGVVVKPNDSELVLYIITAWHVIKSVDPDTGPLELQFLNDEDGQVYTYQYRPGKDQLYKWEERDIAILEIEHYALRKTIPFDIPTVAISKPEFDSNNKCLLRGFPGFKQQIHPFVINSTFERIQQERFFLNPAESLESLNLPVEDAIEGFSGSGVFKEDSDGQFNLVGLFTHLHSGIIRLECVSCIAVNELLTASGKASLTLQSRHTRETNRSILHDLHEIRKESDLIFNRIKDRIGSVHLERQIIQDLLKKSVLANQLVIVTGTAGDGKSAIGKNSLAILAQEGFETLGFKAESFAYDSITNALQDYKINNNLLDILQYKAVPATIVLFIDSAEKLLNQPNYDAFLDLLHWCSQNDNRKIILTCRTYAFNSLILDLLSYFPTSYAVVEVPALTDIELKNVQEQIPSISAFMQQERIYDLLHKPFFASLAVKLVTSNQRKQEFSEKDFKRLIWGEVIEKNVPERGAILTDIARKRANQMSLFAQADNLNTVLTNQLFQEAILDRHPTKSFLFAPAHDIFEDLALTRMIDQQYYRDPSLTVFFKEIGDEPSMRRAYRLWLMEELGELHTSHNLLQFLNAIIGSPDLPNFWKDETIIAVLRSDDCSFFFSENRKIIEGSDYSLFTRLLQLLQTACQEINLSKIQILSKELQVTRFYHDEFLSPVGSGWSECIYFISNHLASLSNKHELIFQFLVEKWGKKIISDHEFPPEVLTGAKLLFRFIEMFKNTFVERESTVLKMGVMLLLKLTSILHDETEKLLTDANQYVYNFEDLKQEEKNRNLRDFYKYVLNQAISWFHGKQVAYCLPEVLTQITFDRWIYRKNRLRDPSDHIYGFGYQGLEDTAKTYGFYLEDRFNNSTASAHITAIDHLFVKNPDVALKLIVDLGNYSIDYYRANSAQLNVVACPLRIGNRLLIQYGNVNYWAAYRSGHIISNNLSSALMSLENWLLNLGRTNETDKIERTFSYLMQNSQYVSTSAVLVSVILAFPEQLGHLALPFLSNVDFLKWDKLRASVKARVLFTDPSYVRVERERSDALPHRYVSLDHLALQLQTNGYFDEVSAIIDKLWESTPSEDLFVRLMLKHMDSRGRIPDLATIVKTGHGAYVQMMPDLEVDLKKMVDESKTDLTRFAGLASDVRWIQETSKQETNSKNLLDDWNLKYETYLSVSETEKDESTFRLFSNPALLASIGIRDLWSQLNSLQKTWCIQTLINQFSERRFKDDHEIELNDSLFALSIALTLPELTKSQRNKLKSIIVNEVIYINTRHPEEYNFLHKLGQKIWKIDRFFGTSLLKGLFAYADQKNDHKPLIYSQRHYYPENNIKPLIKLIATGVVQFDLNSYEFSLSGMNRVCRAILFVPYDTDNEEYRSLVKRQLLFLINHYANLKHRETALSPYDGIHLLHYFVAKFIISQPLDYGLLFFEEILEVLCDSVNAASIVQVRELDLFINELLTQFIMVENETQTGKIWPFWEKLAVKLKEKNNIIGLSRLFFDISWVSSIHEWRPLVGNQTLIKQWVDDFGQIAFPSVIKLINGIGAKELLPEAINWMPKLVVSYMVFLKFSAVYEGKNHKSLLIDKSSLNKLEQFIRHVYFTHKRQIRESNQLKDNFILLLDYMVENGSSISFIIRDRMIGV